MIPQPRQTRQEKYHQTDKGRIAQRKAAANYKARMVRWDLLLSPELSAALDLVKPRTMSRSAFAKIILQKYVDKVAVPDTN